MSRTATRDDFGTFRGTVQRTVIRVWKQHMGDFSTSRCWSPSVNIYRRARQLDVCVDLAGLDRKAIDVSLESNRLIIRGYRTAPEPRQEAEAMQILAMEIDHGPFSREIPLPDNVDRPRVTSAYEDGLLWIRLPLREPA